MTDGMHYAPTARTLKPVCARGDFVFAAMALDHGHIFGMVANLVQAGGVLKLIYDTNPKRSSFCAASILRPRSPALLTRSFRIRM